MYINKFINDNIKLTEKYYVNDDLSNIISKYRFDTFIVGSDQVWREPYARPNIETFFFNFLKSKNVKRIAFSASFGTDLIEYTKEQINICGNLIQYFDLVTIREDSGLELINNIYKWQCKQPPIQTIDPTMLLSKDDYIKISISQAQFKKKGLFFYILDMNDEKQQIINLIKKEFGVKSYTVIGKKYNILKDNPFNYPVPPIEMWIQAFRNADFVFTDSFHGTVFSIIFNKNFLSIGNNKRGLSRFSSILKLFNLKDRIIYSKDDLQKNILHKQIKWDEVNTIWNIEKKKALKLLNNALIK